MSEKEVIEFRGGSTLPPRTDESKSYDMLILLVLQVLLFLGVGFYYLGKWIGSFL